MAKLAISYVVHDDWHYLGESVRSFAPAGPVTVFVSRVPWNDRPGDWERVVAEAEAAGAEVVVGDWPSETEHRRAVLDHALSAGVTHLLIPDGDEIIEPGLLDALCRVAEADLADRVYVEWDTYWSNPEHVIRPRERFTPLVMLAPTVAEHVRVREYQGGRALFLGAEYGLVHHLSYVGPDDRIRRKIRTWGHASEVLSDWWQRSWQGWKQDHTLRNLHPTHPEAYGHTERIVVPEVLSPAMALYEELAGTVARPTFERPADWPSVSVVIPLYGGPEELSACLLSIELCRDLVSEVIVVDDASPDDAASICAAFDVVRLVTHEENRGFAAACNTGAATASCDVVVFLNSDTIVPRAGLYRLIESISKSQVIGAAGPLTNFAAGSQQIAPTYTSLETLDLFAEDWASREAMDSPVSWLVGFCLAVRRRVLEEVGGFDESFGTGMFEDNDLCYRIARAGYQVVLSARAYVHHEGNRSFQRAGIDVGRLLAENEARFRRKWARDLESGFASALPGFGAVAFDHARHPDRTLAEVRAKAARADVSLCMIVRDEERVMRDCLESAAPFFTETVVVDTGSTDATVQICRELGATVIESSWPESFAAARNESLAHATGSWVFWMDADDTLPWATGEAIVDAALSAPPHVHAFVVPVQFVEEGPGAGTRVDHVKLFRRLPGVEFEGRIHEQILPSLRQHGGQVARIDHVVLHSGYDTSPEGQAKKRARDERLLSLDLAERPKHPFVHFNLGMTAHYGGDHEAAVSWLSKGIELAGEGESHVRKAYALLASSQRSLGSEDEALQTLRTGLETVGDDPELHFQIALTLTALGDLPAALDHYERVLSSDTSGHFTSFDIGILGFKTFHNMAGVLASLGRYADAKGRYLEAMQAAPSFLPSAFELFDRAIEAADWAGARECLEHVRAVEGTSRSWCEMTKRYAQAVGGLTNVTATFERLLTTYPAAPDVRLAFARSLLEEGRLAQAAPHLEHLQAIGFAEAAYLLGVARIQMNDLPGARDHTAVAMWLNPGHAQTAEQLRNLNRALGIPEDQDVVL